MASTGKKINELNAISTVSNDTVMPSVYVEGQTTATTATKISVGQISEKVTNNMSTILAGKQDVLTAGTGITIDNNVISASASGGGVIGVFTATNGYEAPANLPLASEHENEMVVVRRQVVNPDETVDETIIVDNILISDGNNWKFLNDWIFFTDLDFEDINEHGSINGIPLKYGDVCYCKSFNGWLYSDGALNGSGLYTWYVDDEGNGEMFDILQAQMKYWWNTVYAWEQILWTDSFQHFTINFASSNKTSCIFDVTSKLHNCQYDIRAGSYDLNLTINTDVAEEVGPVKWFINGKPTTTPVLKAGSYSHLFFNGSWSEDEGNALYAEIFTDIDPYPTMVPCTQAEYDALVQAGTVNSSTLYLIEEESN